MKKNNLKLNKKVMIIGLIILVVIILLLGYFIGGKKLNINSTLVNDLYVYVGNNDLEVCNGLITYTDKKTSYEDLANNSRICVAYSMLEDDSSVVLKIDKTKKNNTCSISENIVFATDNYEDEICTITKIESKLVNEQYKKIYGHDIENYETFHYDNATICYYEDNYYYCGLSETYTYTIGAEPHTYRTVKKAVEKKNKVIIYDYFLKIVNDECYTSFVGDTKNNNCTDGYTADKAIDYKFLKKYGTLYKHTYTKDKDNYYWVSTEPV